MVPWPRDRQRADRHVVSVTFDDGKPDQHTAALPIMSKCGIPAADFTIAGSG
ncbi:polysaccharide deacetylase family protein [Blastococcus aggregatus]|uniref:polysaccharide deacetylase family protein n=1 Tax=Blastococcus aggregatus TaxID=38502 RepID=UPI00114189F6|nr:polysaccharide deacetylase family protein [Blastococcus aggregatus]